MDCIHDAWYLRLLIYYGFKNQVKSRETRIYIDENGNLDFTSSRTYEAKEVSGLQAFWGSPWMFTPGIQIMKFALADGVVSVETKNGKSIKAPLSDLEVIIWDKSRGTECVVLLLKYGDDKIKVTHNSIRFEEEEIEDINAILAHAGKVKESKGSKLSGLLAKFKSIVKDVTDEDDYINLSGDIILSLNEKYRERALVRRSQSDSEPQEESFAKYLEDQLNNIDEKKYPRTQLQIDTDNRIDELITNISNNNLPDENEVKRLLSDSSDKGRQTLLCAYEIGLENRRRNMIHSFIADAVYPLECAWHWIKEMCEDIETLWMLKSFLIGVVICIPLFMFDNLGWWNILLGIGIGCLWMVVSNKNLAKAEIRDNGIRNEIADLRNGILNNPDKENQEASAAAVEVISDNLKSRYKRGKIACWIWSEVIVGILIGCLLVKYGEAESGDTIPLAEQNEVSTMITENGGADEEVNAEVSVAEKAIIDLYRCYYSEEMMSGQLDHRTYSEEIKKTFLAAGINSSIIDPFSRGFQALIDRAEDVGSRNNDVIIDEDLLWGGQGDVGNFNLEITGVEVIDDDHVLIKTNFTNFNTAPQNFLMVRENGTFKIDDFVDGDDSFRKFLQSEIKKVEQYQESISTSNTITINDWKLIGEMGDKYPVVFFLNQNGDKITGRYAYKSTLSKYGNNA